MSKKVWCKNCTFSKEIVCGLYPFNICTAVVSIDYKILQTKELNSEGNCKYYKRKWWKVWV